MAITWVDEWLLDRIQWLENTGSPNRWPTHSNIWQGSYDVWSCEQDRIDAYEIPRKRMKDAEEAGYIKSEVRTRGRFNFVVWSLTDLGRECLKKIKELNSPGFVDGAAI